MQGLVPVKAVASTVICVIVLAGCGPSDYERKGNATHALSQLKKFQTATTAYETEYGGFASFELLLQEDTSGLIDAKFATAWDGEPQPMPLSGYLYSSLDAEDESERIGLCAYPSEPGKTGDVVLCTITDPEEAEEGDVNAFATYGPRWSFYVARVKEVERAPRAWPEEGAARHFTRMQSRKPAEALEEAWRLVEGQL